MKGKRQFLVFTRIDMYRGVDGEWMEIAVPIASIREIFPATSGVKAPWDAVQSKVVMKDDSFYFSNEALASLVARIDA